MDWNQCDTMGVSCFSVWPINTSWYLLASFVHVLGDMQCPDVSFIFIYNEITSLHSWPMSKHHLSLSKKWEAQMSPNVVAQRCQLLSGPGNQPCSLPLDRWWICPSESGEAPSFLAPRELFSFSLSLVLFTFVMMQRMENTWEDLEIIIIYVRSMFYRPPSAYKHVISSDKLLQQSVRQAGQVVSFTFQKISSWILKKWRTEGGLETCKLLNLFFLFTNHFCLSEAFARHLTSVFNQQSWWWEGGKEGLDDL